jgi:hypothetical protein
MSALERHRDLLAALSGDSGEQDTLGSVKKYLSNTWRIAPKIRSKKVVLCSKHADKHA